LNGDARVVFQIRTLIGRYLEKKNKMFQKIEKKKNFLNFEILPKFVEKNTQKTQI